MVNAMPNIAPINPKYFVLFFLSVITSDIYAFEVGNVAAEKIPPIIREKNRRSTEKKKNRAVIS